MTIDTGHAHARTTDPETSHKAARSQKVADMRMVYAIIRDFDEAPTAAEIAVGLMLARSKSAELWHDVMPELFRIARMVSRRVSDLAQAEDGRPDIESAGVRKCDVTGAEATTWRVCPKQEELL